MKILQDVRRSTSNILTKETEWLLEEKHKRRKGLSLARDIEKLQRGEHIDYVIGFVDFLGCKIDLSKKPLIPRAETEYWVEKAISDCSNSVFSLRFTPPAGRGPTRLQKSRSFRIRCLDVFSGSGCIGVAVLKHIPQTHVDFAEKEKKFCDQIKINAKLNGIEPKRYGVVQSDIFSNLKDRKYDFIFANPPYLAESRKDRVQASVLKNEPREALFAGKDGLQYIRALLNQVKQFLASRGTIYLEFDSFQKLAITKIARSCGFRNVEFHKDQYARWRFAVLKT